VSAIVNDHRPVQCPVDQSKQVRMTRSWTGGSGSRSAPTKVFGVSVSVQQIGFSQNYFKSFWFGGNCYSAHIQLPSDTIQK
jgi:hypothetical protein